MRRDMTDRDELGVNRRRFCQQVVYVGFGSYLALASGACRSRRESETTAAPEGSGWLTPMEVATLAAACERLFPADEDPGAIALGAPAFIDRQLTSEAFWGWQKAFRRSLAELDADAQARYQRSFARLAAGEQDALLEAWIHGPKPHATF